MKKILKTIGWCLVTVFVVYTFYFLWAQSQPKPDVYELLKPAVRDIERSCVATGQIEPRLQINVKPRTTGILSALLVKEGQHVSVGQVIARVQIIPDMNALNDAQSGVQTAKLQLDETSKETNRVISLYKKGVVSKEEYEQASNKLSLARETLTKSRSLLDIVLKGSSGRSRSVNTTMVTSTMNGTIISLPLKVGASVVSTNPYTEGTTIATIADMRTLRFTGKIDEVEVEHLHIGMPMTITIGAMQDKKLTGEVDAISTMGNKENGTIMFQVKGVAHGLLASNISRAGYSANASMVTDRRTHVMSVEEAAIEYEGDKTYVWKLTSNPDDVNSQKFERVPVVTGLSDGLYIEIVKGISQGDILRGNKKN
jgi:HlyD family secretion protein